MTATYEITSLGQTTIAGRTFQVSEMTYMVDGEPSSCITLDGPRGGSYMLGPASPTGVRQIIGANGPLRSKGNAVYVVMFGGVIEQIKR